MRIFRDNAGTIFDEESETPELVMLATEGLKRLSEADQIMNLGMINRLKNSK